MPGLNQTLRNSTPAGYEAAPARPVPPLPMLMPSKGNFGSNSSIRTPLPPFNIGPDTLRQFDQSEGVAPKRRVIPLPIQSQVGGGGAVINNNTTISSGSGGGGGTAA